MKTIQILVFALAIGLSATARTQPTPASVFITAGQSNADGRASIDTRPSYLDGGYRFLRYANVTRASDGRFTDFEFGKRFAFCDITNYYIEQALQRDFYAIKCAYGGTAIALRDTHPKHPVWWADKEWISRNKAYRGNIDEGKSLTLALTEGFKDCVDSTLSHLPGGYDVKAIMWHQGESDHHEAAEYYRNFKEMILFMRQQIFRVTGKEKDLTLPFIFGTISHASKQYSEVVEEAQRRVASELPGVYLIDLSDAGLLGDGLHFDGPWTEYVGKVMYNKLVELQLVDGQPLSVEKPRATCDDGQTSADIVQP